MLKVTNWLLLQIIYAIGFPATAKNGVFEK